MPGWDVSSNIRGLLEAEFGTPGMQNSVLQVSSWCRRWSRRHCAISDKETRLNHMDEFPYYVLGFLFPSFCRDLGFVFLRKILNCRLWINISGTPSSCSHCFPLKYSGFICPVHLSVLSRCTWCIAECSRWCGVIQCPTFFFGSVLLFVRTQVWRGQLLTTIAADTCALILFSSAYEKIVCW